MSLSECEVVCARVTSVCGKKRICGVNRPNSKCLCVFLLVNENEEFLCFFHTVIII